MSKYVTIRLANGEIIETSIQNFFKMLADEASYGAVLYVQQPQANQVISQFLGGPAPVAATTPPGPYGVEPTTTTTTAPPGTYSGGGGTTPTTASSETTTTIETDFDPTPC